MLETEPQLIEAYVATGKAKIVYRHLLQLGDLTERAAEASECAADQGAFWEMRHTLYERQGEVYSAGDGDTFFGDTAEGLGLDRQTFDTCLAGNTHRDEVRADNDAATAAGIRSRPVFVIGEQRLVGTQPIEQFERLLGQP